MAPLVTAAFDVAAGTKVGICPDVTVKVASPAVAGTPLVTGEEATAAGAISGAVTTAGAISGTVTLVSLAASTPAVAVISTTGGSVPCVDDGSTLRVTSISSSVLTITL